MLVQEGRNSPADVFLTEGEVIRPVRLDGDPQHAGFHFRANMEVSKTNKETYYVRPDGRGKPGETRNWDAKGKDPKTVNLPWDACSFVVGGKRYTVLRISHPDNPKEARGSERDYGRFGDYFEYDLTPKTPLKLKYRVWAQALGFEAAKAAVTLNASQRRNLTLEEIKDAERRFRQLPGEMMVAALPDATPEDAHMKKIFMNNCTGCHATSYALQFRFDEAGWSKIIDLMKVVPVNGVYPGPNAKPSQVLERNQKQLAAYLARARGPGESSMKITARPRPTGEAARAVWEQRIATVREQGIEAIADAVMGRYFHDAFRAEKAGTVRREGEPNGRRQVAIDGKLFVYDGTVKRIFQREQRPVAGGQVFLTKRVVGDVVRDAAQQGEAFCLARKLRQVLREAHAGDLGQIGRAHV